MYTGEIRLIRKIAGNCCSTACCCIAAIGYEIVGSAVCLISSNVPQILLRGVAVMHASFALITGYINARGYKKDRNPGPLGILVSTLIYGIYDPVLDESVVDTSWGGPAMAIALMCLIINILNSFFLCNAGKYSYCSDPLFGEGTENGMT